MLVEMKIFGTLYYGEGKFKQGDKFEMLKSDYTKYDRYVEKVPEVGNVEETRIEEKNTDMMAIEGMTQDLMDELNSLGFTSIRDIAEASVKELMSVKGIGKKTAIKFIDYAESLKD